MSVFVHGAWHGTWCWEQVEQHLGALSTTSVAVDVPGRGDDARPPSALTLDSYGDCTVAIRDKATGLLVPEPIGPATTPVHVTPDGWGSAPRSYILCTQDRIISPAHQRAMIDSVGVDRVIEMDSSHSPFLSQPERLATLLVDLED